MIQRRGLRRGDSHRSGLRNRRVRTVLRRGQGSMEGYRMRYRRRVAVGVAEEGRRRDGRGTGGRKAGGFLRRDNAGAEPRVRHDSKERKARGSVRERH